ncbi:hypothetical protein [Streptomyces sp. N2A]|uniref:hypothetical protein n=1 Tax=Streptomyces sp. N2A TaxID=3073936 RepID=UPI00286FE3B5|nr:hypothetical protein [Streptomyces sp. N2A]
MADIRNTAPFKALETQTSAEPLTRGLTVEAVAVRNVLLHMVTTVADRMGIQPRSALRYLDAAAVADTIARPPTLTPKAPTPSKPPGRCATMTAVSWPHASSTAAP